MRCEVRSHHALQTLLNIYFSCFFMRLFDLDLTVELFSVSCMYEVALSATFPSYIWKKAGTFSPFVIER